jgi:hypothetical protein
MLQVLLHWGPDTVRQRTTIGGRVQRSAIVSIVIAALLALACVSSAAADDQVTPPSAEASAPGADSLPSGGSGEISIDPVFITPTPEATPASVVKGSTHRPDPTPPSTDASASTQTQPGPGSPALLALVSAACLILLVAARLPATRHR